MDTLPRVVDHLLKFERQKAIFTKPVPEILFGEDSSASPKVNTMAVRQLTLKKYCVTPIHVHEKKEKIYEFKGPGNLVVGIFIDDLLQYFTLKKDGLLVVPAGCPHFIKYFPYRGQDECKVLVITSSQDGNDIRWEDGADDLVKYYLPTE